MSWSLRYWLAVGSAALLALAAYSGWEIARLSAAEPPQKPIDCFAPNLTPQEGIECLKRIQERRNFEAMLKALQK